MQTPPAIEAFRQRLSQAAVDRVIDSDEASALVALAASGADASGDSDGNGLGPNSPYHYRDELIELRHRGVALEPSAAETLRSYVEAMGLRATDPCDQGARDRVVARETELVAGRPVIDASTMSQLFDVAREEDLDHGRSWAGPLIDAIDFYLYEFGPLRYPPESLTPEAREVQRQQLRRLEEWRWNLTSF